MTSTPATSVPLPAPGRQYEVRASCRTRTPGEPVEVLAQDSSVPPEGVDPASAYLVSSQVSCDGAVHVVPLPADTGTPVPDFCTPPDGLDFAWAVVVPVEVAG